MSMTSLKIKAYLGEDARQIFLLILVMTLAICPILSSDFFFQQDGLGHLYTSYVMKEIVSANPFFYDYFSLNSFAVPNSLGHWLMAGLAHFFDVGTVSKIIVILSLVSIPMSVMVMRWQVYGFRDIWIFGIFGFVISLNTLWFVGAYNFIFGTAVMITAIGFYMNWSQSMTLFRSVIMALFFILCFIGHIVSFGMLVGTVVLLIIFADKKNRKRTFAFTSIAFIAIAPFLAAYLVLGAGGEPMWPNWRHVNDFYSIGDWFRQFITFDPFAMISRRTIPFTNIDSNLAILFVPIIWICVGVCFWLISNIIGRTPERIENDRSVLFFVAIVAIITSIIGPDDLGLLNGSILRERLLICGVLILVPSLSPNSQVIKKIGLVIFVAVTFYQSAVLWEFANKGAEDAKIFQEAKAGIDRQDKIASIVVIENSRRFHSIPVTQMINSIGFGNDIIVLDNYEIGHRLFPLVARSKEQQQFTFQLTTSNVFYLDRNRNEEIDKLEKLDTVLSINIKHFDKLVVWGHSDEVDQVILKYFDKSPVYTNGQVRVLIRKAV